MKTERARELYSDYLEGLLSPALAQALEQHFETEPDAHADYEQFKQMYSLLDTPRADEVEVPLGFRAKVLELAAEEHARREAAPTRRAALSLTGWFAALGSFRQRRATGGILAAFAVIALAAVLVHQVSPSGVSTTGFGLSGAISAPTTIKSVTASAAPDGSTTHLFHIHLPASVRQATVMAYVIKGADQIADPSNALRALTGAQSLTNDEELQIPVTLMRPAPPGTTLDLLVQWTPADTRQTAGAQVVFTPLQQGIAPTANGESPISGNFFNALEALAAEYNVTVVADATTTPNATITAPSAGDDAPKALNEVAAQVGYKVQKLGDATYQIYTP